jgi:HK97 family phage prohead protease
MAAQAPRNGREQRRITLDSVEVRADATGDEIRVNGHAAVWDKPAWIGPPKFGFSERFQPGAFKESINGGADVRYLFNHNPDAVLARTKSGTLRLGEDASGLTVDANLAPTSVGRDLAILMSRGDVNQMSVGMQVLEDRWEEASGNDGNLYEQRTIIRAKLFDVSAVTYPAYEDTDAGLRDANLARELRDARGVEVARRKKPDVAPPDPPRTARVEVLPDGDLRIHRPDGTTVNVSGETIGRGVAFDGTLAVTSTATTPANTAITVPSAGLTLTDADVTIHNNHFTPEPAPGAVSVNTGGTPPPPQTPPSGGDETPENPASGGVLPPSGPATATSNENEVRQGGHVLSDAERALLELIQEHWNTQEHRKAPRLKCPACNRPATATGDAQARPSQ